MTINKEEKPMKVLLVNGSSRKNGCTNVALEEAARALQEEGIETEIFFIGNQAYPDCIACRKCKETRACVFGDVANELAEKAKECDGFIFGSPVYYAHPSARLLNVLDRAFFSAGENFAYKPGAGVLSARRAGTTASFDVINKYFTINSMPIVSSTYWNHVYGSQAEEVSQDKEGLMTMYNLGKNMAWMLKCIALGKENGIDHPVNGKVSTNFIR
jgi:multimeric flavodoxin WrbA